jgi:putative Mg2+ transporter-C (MgtC) family protein
MDIEAESVLRLGAALLAGGVIGVNREVYGKPAGVRVHALVSLGTAILVLAGERGMGPLDPNAVSRIIQGIVAGIGFLCAGAILRAPDGMKVFHLTTSATLWVTTAVGVLCGMGAWIMAGVATVLVLFVLSVGKLIDAWLYNRAKAKDDDIT